MILGERPGGTESAHHLVSVTEPDNRHRRHRETGEHTIGQSNGPNQSPDMDARHRELFEPWNAIEPESSTNTKTANPDRLKYYIRRALKPLCDKNSNATNGPNFAERVCLLAGIAG